MMIASVFTQSIRSFKMKMSFFFSDLSVFVGCVEGVFV